MGDARSTSTTSSGAKRKRAAPVYYAVKLGHEPGIYYSWEDAKRQTAAFKNPILKKCNTLAEAEEFMKSGSYSPARPGKSKYYGVQVGHRPGVYTDWPSVLQQVTGYKGGKQKKFDTWEEAQAYVNEAKGATPSDSGAAISLKGHLESTLSVGATIKAPKKQKKNDGSALAAITNGDFEPGTGPLPPGAEDGFDRTLKLDLATGAVQYKTYAELSALKMQPTGEFEGPLKICTDGATKGNGKIGAYAGLGVWFGPNDPRNIAEPLTGEKQTNQRAELTAIARALDIAPINRSAIIYTDSHYSLKCLTVWFQKWEQNDWKNSAGKPVENKDLIEPILARIRERELSKATTKIIWIKAHNGHEGNEGADALANQGATQRQAQQQMKARAGHSEIDVEPHAVDKPGMGKAHAFAEYGAQEGQAQINGIFGYLPGDADV